jgi:hypothetical protein
LGDLKAVYPSPRYQQPASRPTWYLRLIEPNDLRCLGLALPFPFDYHAPPPLLGMLPLQTPGGGLPVFRGRLVDHGEVTEIGFGHRFFYCVQKVTEEPPPLLPPPLQPGVQGDLVHAGEGGKYAEADDLITQIARQL